MAFSSRDVDRLGRHIEALMANPVTKAVLESPPVDCSGRTLGGALSYNQNRGRGGGRGRGRGYGRGGTRSFYNRGQQGYGNRRGRGRGRGFNNNWRRSSYDSRPYGRQNYSYDQTAGSNSTGPQSQPTGGNDNSKFFKLNSENLYLTCAFRFRLVPSSRSSAFME